MSGIYIPGMEMPKSCDMCWALDDYSDYPRCRITEEQRGYNFPVREQRMGNCPLVPVPPHGKLIDADAVGDFLRNKYWNSPWVRSHILDKIVRDIKGFPTIIPADPIKGETK